MECLDSRLEGQSYLNAIRDLWVISNFYLKEAFGKTGRCTITGYKSDFD